MGGTARRRVGLGIVLAVIAGCNAPIALRTAPAAVDACEQDGVWSAGAGTVVSAPSI